MPYYTIVKVTVTDLTLHFSANPQDVLPILILYQKAALANSLLHLLDIRVLHPGPEEEDLQQYT